MLVHISIFLSPHGCLQLSASALLLELLCCLFLNISISFLGFQLSLLQGNGRADIPILANANSLVVYTLVDSSSIASYFKELTKTVMLVWCFQSFFFPPCFPSSSRNFSSDGRNVCSCFYPHCIFIYRKHKWGGSGAFSLLGKIKNPQAALWPWQCKGMVLDNTCKSPGDALHLHFFKNSNDWFSCTKGIFYSELVIFHYTACPSYSLHVTMPSINSFKLITWPSRLMFHSTLCSTGVYAVVSTAL